MRLPEIRLPAPAAVPPIVFDGGVLDEDGRPLGKADDPTAIGADGLPCDHVAGVELAEDVEADEVLPEIRLIAPGVVPPIVLRGRAVDVDPGRLGEAVGCRWRRCRGVLPQDGVAGGEEAGDHDARRSDRRRGCRRRGVSPPITFVGASFSRMPTSWRTPPPGRGDDRDAAQRRCRRGCPGRGCGWCCGPRGRCRPSRCRRRRCPRRGRCRRPGCRRRRRGRRRAVAQADVADGVGADPVAVDDVAGRLAPAIRTPSRGVAGDQVGRRGRRRRRRCCRARRGRRRGVAQGGVCRRRRCRSGCRRSRLPRVRQPVEVDPGAGVARDDVAPRRGRCRR